MRSGTSGRRYTGVVRAARQLIGAVKRAERPMLQQHPYRRLKVGIIGAGQVVEDSHLPVLSSLPKVEIQWISDRDEARCEFMGKMYGVPYIPAERVQDALYEIDVCLIAIPLGVREPYLRLCAAHGVTVYVEKPIARTLNEHDTLLQLFDPLNPAVGFQRRCYKTTLMMQSIIQDKLFGSLIGVNGSLAHYELKSGGKSKFITDKTLSGGGIVIESAIHTLDQILFASHASDILVSAATGIVEEGIEFEVTSTASMTVNNSSVPITLFISRLTNRSQQIDFLFEEATVRMYPGPTSPLLVSSHREASHPYTLDSVGDNSGVAYSTTQAFYIYWRTFLENIGQSTGNFTLASEARLTTSWVEQIYNVMDDYSSVAEIK